MQKEPCPFQQPSEWKFIKQLAQEEPVTFHWAPPCPVVSPVIVKQYDDPEGLLESAVGYLQKFMAESIGFSFPVTLSITGQTWEKETFELNIKDESAEITGDSPEGLRRGIYELVRLWRGSLTPHLPPQKFRKTAWVRNRISRCFFSPINRPPANRDELLDDENYYPDPYLNRLAYSGINALWLSAELNQLCGTSFTGPADEAVCKRIAKLQKTIDRCRRYGIRIFLQMNEPVAQPVESEFYCKNPTIRGPECSGRNCFCPSSREGKEYLEEACRNIFSSVKHLGGLLNITLGEGMTTCASGDYTKCPRCSQNSWKEILFKTWRAMRKGMDEADATEADLICWLYLPARQKLDARIFDLLDGTPDRVIIQLNCESGGMIRQCGKDYYVGDYWLSMDKPCDNFIRFAEKAAKNGVEISAKIQVGCSHEVATVPFVPVPGLLYRKYSILKKWHVSTIMQCWYFGNYPGLMNDAAGQLSFAPYPKTEKAFLQDFARTYWGKEAVKAASSWQAFGNAYRNYPASNMIQYFGPVADGISWPLYFQPQNRGLTPTWLLEPEVNGDNIVECLKEMPMEDVITQLDKLSKKWHAAFAGYADLRETFAHDPECQLELNVAEALDLQFHSALDIMLFYQARSRMISLLNREIVNTRRMIRLTEQESLLGFHSEAEGYKYYPEKLKWRLTQLMKANDCAEYEVGSGWIKCETFRWKVDPAENNTLHLRAEMKGFLPDMDEFYLGLDDCGTSFPALLHADYMKTVFVCHPSMKCVVNVQKDGWSVDLDIDPDQYTKNRPVRLNLIRLTNAYKTRFSWPEQKVFLPPKLGLVFYQPANMGILRFGRKE